MAVADAMIQCTNGSATNTVLDPSMERKKKGACVESLDGKHFLRFPEHPTKMSRDQPSHIQRRRCHTSKDCYKSGRNRSDA